MTELQRAIEWLEFMQESGYETETEQQHCRVLLDALRKQTEPMDVIEDQWATCPACGYEELERIAHVDSADFETRKIVISETWMPKHCPECGQKLRWSEPAPPKE